MAFETGLIFGAKYFGPQLQRARDLLVLDERAHQFNKTLSDLRGIDGEGHVGNPARAIGAVRKFLARKSGDPRIPGEAFIIRRFKQFQRDLTRMTASTNAKYKARELESPSYLADWMNLMVEWLKPISRQCGCKAVSKRRCQRSKCVAIKHRAWEKNRIDFPIGRIAGT